jgi:CO/xanthine dehydrogenase FAD-binding subunit
MNTRFLEAEFDYVKPSTLGEALEVLSGDKLVRIFAGGTDLIVKMKMGAMPLDIMMDINGIPELFEVKETADGGVCIGAAAKLTALEKNEKLLKDYPALVEAIHAMASVSVRNMATLGGNFINASPVADAVAACLAYDGSVALEKKGGKRLVKAEEFFVGPGKTVMEQDEMVTAIILPPVKANTGAVYSKLARVKSDIAKLTVCVVLDRDGDSIGHARITMSAVAARPLYVKDISEGMAGKKVSMDMIKQTAADIAAFIKPIDDNRTTAEYRKEVTAVIARDAIAEAWKRSGGAL